jgi:hypothetical protein
MIYYRNNQRKKLKIITSKNYENKTLPKIEDEKISFEYGG